MNFPEDDMEEVRENLFREAALGVLPLIQTGIAHVIAASSVEVGWAQLMFALGLESRSMRDVAAKLNVTVACISKGAKEFVRENNLPTPACMKSDDASESYRNARNNQLQPIR